MSLANKRGTLAAFHGHETMKKMTIILWIGGYPVLGCSLVERERAAQLSVHRWTSTCELPSSVCTAGPQPASCPAQCAPLDLNLRAAQLSVHRWTSTCELPSSVCRCMPGIDGVHRSMFGDLLPQGMHLQLVLALFFSHGCTKPFQAFFFS